MAEVVSLNEAIASLLQDGDNVALEGFTHLIPFAAGHEILLQGRRELELIRMNPYILYGAGPRQFRGRDAPRPTRAH